MICKECARQEHDQCCLDRHPTYCTCQHIGPDGRDLRLPEHGVEPAEPVLAGT